jgi:hypothetical protein
MPLCTVKVYSATLAGEGVGGEDSTLPQIQKSQTFLRKYLDDFLSKYV